MFDVRSTEQVYKQRLFNSFFILTEPMSFAIVLARP